MDAFFSKTRDLINPGTAADWTTLIKPVLWEIGIEHTPRFTINCGPFVYRGEKVGHREVMIDFLYFPREREDTERTLHPPAVAIEHENYWCVKETRKDFFKVCLCNVPLGAIVGYHETAEKAKATGKSLVQYYEDWWKASRILTNEVLVIMGWKHLEPPREWHWWLLPKNRDHWESSCPE